MVHTILVLLYTLRVSIVRAYVWMCVGVGVVPPQVWNEFGERMKIYAKQKRKWREESVRR